MRPVTIAGATIDKVPVVILAGGQGTRMHEETEFRPKPLVMVGGHPILWHVMKTYAHHGFRDFVICLGYRGDMIKEYFLNYEAMNSDFSISLGQQRHITYHDRHPEQDYMVTLADTGASTMTGGRVARIKRYIPADTFMCTYGDGVGDIDVRLLYEFHRSHGKLATVTTVRPHSRYGSLEFDSDGIRVLRFNEKPAMEGSISAGFFVFDRRVFDYLAGDECVLEAEPLERLAREGQLMGYRHDGAWHAMDTHRDVLFLNELWGSGRARWRVWD